jgi:hypothetical protein
LRALATADTRRLDEPLRAVFSASGTTHLLSVSGTHVVFVVWLVQAGIAFGLRRTRWLPAVRGAPRSASRGRWLGYAFSAVGPPALRPPRWRSPPGSLIGGRRRRRERAALAGLSCSRSAAAPSGIVSARSWPAGLLLWRPPAGPAARLGARPLPRLAAPLAAAIGAPLPADWLVQRSVGAVLPDARARAAAGSVSGRLESLASPDLLAGRATRSRSRSRSRLRASACARARSAAAPSRSRC